MLRSQEGTAEGPRAQRAVGRRKRLPHFALIDYPDVVIRPLACLVLAALPLLAQKPAPFEVEEAFIASWT
jgi:hypothetical protein